MPKKTSTSHLGRGKHNTWYTLPNTYFREENKDFILDTAYIVLNNVHSRSALQLCTQLLVDLL
jgi:hypothetical protein